MSRPRTRNELVYFSDLTQNTRVGFNSLRFELNNARSPGWYGTLEIDNQSFNNEMFYSIAGITEDPALGISEQLDIGNGQRSISPSTTGTSIDSTIITEEERLANADTIVRIDYSFADNYPVTASQPSGINNVVDAQGLYQFTVRPSTSLNSTITVAFNSTAPAAGYFGTFTFSNTTSSIMTLYVEGITGGFPTVDLIPDNAPPAASNPVQIAAGGTAFFTRNITNRLQDATTVIRAVYTFLTANFIETLNQPPQGLIVVSNTLGQEVELTVDSALVTSSRNFIYSFSGNPAASGYFGTFTFRNINNTNPVFGPIGSSMSFYVRAVTTGFPTLDLIGTAANPVSLAAGTNAVFTRAITNRLQDATTRIVLTYDIFDPAPEIFPANPPSGTTRTVVSSREIFFVVQSVTSLQNFTYSIRNTLSGYFGTFELRNQSASAMTVHVEGIITHPQTGAVTSRDLLGSAASRITLAASGTTTFRPDPQLPGLSNTIIRLNYTFNNSTFVEPDFVNPSGLVRGTWIPGQRTDFTVTSSPGAFLSHSFNAAAPVTQGGWYGALTIIFNSASSASGNGGIRAFTTGEPTRTLAPVFSLTGQYVLSLNIGERLSSSATVIRIDYDYSNSATPAILNSFGIANIVNSGGGFIDFTVTAAANSPINIELRS
jgi:hypothetical protein